MHRYFRMLKSENRQRKKKNIVCHSTQTAKLALIQSTRDRNEIRTSLKKFQGLGQRRNLIKMEIRPGDAQLCFCHWHSVPLSSSLLDIAEDRGGVSLETERLFHPRMTDFIFLF